ncbi:MAG TPA: proteinase inhibitor I4 serpin, partial [Actinomycetota bacterium]|nr:proteinase inhibitor I4 serpin [Actinomycetota bacterium]
MSPSPGTSIVDRAVAASNALTARWIRTIESPSFVASGACVWPLLAALADGAAGNARDELEEAIGLPAADGLAGAAAFFDMLEWLDSAAVAIGVWLRDSIVLD